MAERCVHVGRLTGYKHELPQTLVKLPGDAGYRAHIENRDKTIMFDLDFKPTKKPIRHGTDGGMAAARLRSS